MRGERWRVEGNRLMTLKADSLSECQHGKDVVPNLSHAYIHSHIHTYTHTSAVSMCTIGLP